MEYFTILAQTAQTAGNTAGSSGSLVPLDQIWEQITSLGLLEALMFVSFGVVWLFYGWRVFKVLVVISFALLGLCIGTLISDRVGGGNSPLLGIAVGVVLAIISIPMMRWAVSILGAAAGGILTAAIWYSASLPQQYIWAGALVGVVAGGMISFIVFKIAVMLFSSLGGSCLIFMGGLALLFLYSGLKEDVKHLFYTSQWFLPLAITIPAIIGIYWQNKFIKGSSNWSV